MNPRSSWLSEHTRDDCFKFITEMSMHHALKGGVEGKRIADCIISGDLPSLCNWSLCYKYDDDPIELRECRQALGYYSKCTYIDIGIDKEAVALAQFLKAEALCCETNSMFRAWMSGRFQFRPLVEQIFHLASMKITRVLGDVPPLSDLRIRFGPGSTTRTKKIDASHREKLGAGVSCSEYLLPYVHDVLAEMPHLADLLATDHYVDADGDEVALVPVAVDPGKLGFVPKNAKTFRSIVTEPVLNGMVQLGIGGYIAERLLAFGVDLRDQSRNQRLAREGSLTGALATLDLSSASDTISTELVGHLLPVDWFEFLRLYRSGEVSYHGIPLKLHKFSSMGNGFTFPLESLIFWALTTAACDVIGVKTGNISVYGDDIICPTCAVPAVSAVLEAAGFVINTDKSYADGPFRESCGADYYLGIDIRPYYHKEPWKPADLFVLHNYYVRTNQHEAAAMVLKNIHPSLMLVGPDGYGDGHLLGDYEPRPFKRELGYGGYVFDTFSTKNRRDMRPLVKGDAVLPHYSIYVQGNESAQETDVDQLVRAVLARMHGNTHYGYAAKIAGPYDARVKPGYDGYKRISIYTLTQA